MNAREECVEVSDANEKVHAVPIPHGFVPVRRGRVEYGDFHLNAVALNDDGRVAWKALSRKDIGIALRDNIYSTAKWYSLLIRPEPVVYRHRLTPLQMRVLHAVAEAGPGAKPTSVEVVNRLGAREPLLGSTLARLAERGFLVQTSVESFVAWELGPLCDVLKEEGLLGGPGS